MRRAATLTGLVLGVLLLTPALGAAAEFLGKWGTSGTGEGQFQTVGGIATDRNGHVYAADSRGRVEKFTTAGGFVRSIGAPPSPRGEDRRDPVSGRRRRGAERKSLRRRVLEPGARLGVVPDRSLPDLLRRPRHQRRPALHAGPDRDRRRRFRLRRGRRQSSNPEVHAPTAATSPRSGAARGCSSRRTSSRRRAGSRSLRTGASTRATSSTAASSTTLPTAASSAASVSWAAVRASSRHRRVSRSPATGRSTSPIARCRRCSGSTRAVATWRRSAGPDPATARSAIPPT